MLSCLSLERHVGLASEESIGWNGIHGKEIDISHEYYEENGQNEIQGQLLEGASGQLIGLPEYDDFVTDEDEFESDFDDEAEWDEKPESPATLLAFAASATNDIRNFFNRNQGNEDFCDIYEDRFKSVKPGRELYYADLLAEIGSGKKEQFKRPQTSKCCSATSSANEHTITMPCGKTVRCHLPHQGQLDVNFGLGPFQELFDSVLRKSLIQDTTHRSVITEESALHKYPEALWEPPKHQQTLDFDDLLADWTTDNSGYV